MSDAGANARYEQFLKLLRLKRTSVLHEFVTRTEGIDFHQ